MNWQRYFKHIIIGQWHTKRAFPTALLNTIEQMISTGETIHGGELRFVVEGSLDFTALRQQQNPRQRALEVFSLLGMWDTQERNGVLIYLLLADQAVEIIADRGVHAHVGSEGWAAICQQMESYLRLADYEGGVIVGIEAVNHLLSTYYPRSGEHVNELPNAPVIL
jgi:uncharacterized membrane protein